MDRIKRREWNFSIRKERSYERERINGLYEKMLRSLNNIVNYTFKDRFDVFLGWNRNKDYFKRKKKEIKEIKDNISDISEEEDMKVYLILCF